MAKDLKVAKAVRAATINTLTDILDSAKEAAEDTSQHLEFKLRYNTLEQLQTVFDTQHSQVLALAAVAQNPQTEVEDSVRKQFHKTFFQIKTLYLQIFNENIHTLSNDTPIAPPVTPNVKLPKIDLPHFDGNFKAWPTFFDLFKTLIHENSSLSNIERFQYLLTSLSKEPLSYIKSYPVTEQNYHLAYDALVQRYQNKRKLTCAYWEEILKVKLTSSSSQPLRHLLNTYRENLAVLKNLGFEIDKFSDFILFHSLVTKLDMDLRQRFERLHTSTEIPSYASLIAFLLNECCALESTETTPLKSVNKFSSSSTFDKLRDKSLKQNNSSFSSHKPHHFSSSSFSRPPTSLVVDIGHKGNNNCIICRGSHSIYNCQKFMSSTPQERYQLAKTNRLCINCLRSKHQITDCKSSSTCKQCKSRHHSLLHFEKTGNTSHHPSSSSNHPVASDASSSNDPSPPQTSAAVEPPVTVCTNMSSPHITVLLSTAIVEVLDSKGCHQPVRVLLDSGSQANFISEKCVNRLGLPRSRLCLPIQGLGPMTSTASNGVTSCTLRSTLDHNQYFHLEAVIMPKICSDMPSTALTNKSWPHLKGLKLADPKFDSPASVDMLLGAEIFPQLLLSGNIRGHPHEPIAVNTVLGWVVMGRIASSPPSYINSFFTSSEFDIDNTLKKFWEVEEVTHHSPVSSDDLKCEEHFISSHFRDSSGRYVVSLPFKSGEPTFNNSREVALRRFLSLEKRLLQHPTLYESYAEFMRDYLDSGHMQSVNHFSSSPHEYYIPHHCVLKPESTTTKLRVVFDASAKASNMSLNDTLFIGPKLQKDISNILLHFRSHLIVFTADIKQMYRQIMVIPSHRAFQRILWRFKPTDPVQDYQLNTVTYGVSSSPYLALRVLAQLAHDEQNHFPLASRILQSDVYVDDIITGCDSVEQALILQQELVQLLAKGGFELRKWASNHPDLLSTVPLTHCQLPLSLDNESNQVVKILGLQWQPSSDTFSFKVTSFEQSCTKRGILSELARIFDPLGFLSPLTFYAKYFMQLLWSLGLDWDEQPPSNLLDRWLKFKAELPLISHTQVPRHLVVNQYHSLELHGFCDASERGYAAVIYFRSTFPNGQIVVNFAIAKSKVSPLKRITLPRLELCAAKLLSDLIAFVLETYRNRFHFDRIFAWSDSAVTLSWIKSSPHRWQTFVSNRVSHIQDKIAPSLWHHIRSEDNPADCASRGLLPSQIIDHPLWWAGPPWLSFPQESWNPSKVDIASTSDICSQEEKTISLVIFNNLEVFDHLLTRFSSLSKIQRIIAYASRFIHNTSKRSNQRSGPLCDEELCGALLILIGRVQSLSFTDEIIKLQQNKPLCKSFRKLNPFLDKDGLLRVGGRLVHSELDYDQKHPLLLPRQHRLTELLIQQVHRQHLHPGLQTLQHLLSRQFWILSAKRAIQHVLSKCYRCFRANPKSLQPFMGNLPSVRITQAKAFVHTGIDYGGPFLITTSKTRGAKTVKAYVCLFVCLATKAIHLELSSSLSTDAFLAALRRFIARRGRCSRLFSDNGTNFVGANRQIQQFMQDAAAIETIKWDFNPPSAPHFGGIWEAGIKSTKTHLKRVVGDQILTYEEFNTVLVQIEAILNSRPLCALSSDPTDLAVLTPGHFLTLEPIAAIPEPDLTEIKLNRLDRWQLVQRLQQDFWKRWHAEYLHTLQQRHKWTDSTKHIEVNSLVLIKDELTPSLHWRLARVIALHPGKDNISRVATLHTNQGVIQRPVVKLCPLPTY